MLQRYKLRLGDGTVLGVDHASLRTWALDGKAMVQAADSHQWYPLREFLAAEYVAARRAARQRQREQPAGPQRPLPLVYPKQREAKAPPPTVPPPLELPPFISGPSEIQAPSEPADPPLDLPSEQISAADQALPAEPILDPPFEPAQDAAPLQSWVDDPAVTQVLTLEAIVAEPLTEDFAPVIIPEAEGKAAGPLLGDGDATAGPSSLLSPSEEAPPFVVAEPFVIGEPAGVQALADEPAVSPAPPLPPPQSALSAGSRPSFQVLADDLATGRAGTANEAKRPDDDLPIIPLKPLDDEAPVAAGRGSYDESRSEIEPAPDRRDRSDTLARWLARAVSGYDAFFTRWLDRLARAQGRFSPSVSAPKPPPVQAFPRSTVHDEGLQPPPPLRDLPVLRFADTRDPAAKGDVYEARGRPDRVWRPTRRFVVTGILLSGGVLALLRYETWVPGTQRLGQAIIAEIDRVKKSRDQTVEQRQAEEEATEKLPHLAPQTIQLLLASSPDEILDPPELFRIGSDAADRGVGALTSGETKELKKLVSELLKSLRPSERERLREYDAARVRRLVFPFEGRDVLELFGRGAYSLPAERRERLQELLGKAIAAGLAASSQAPPPTAPKP